MRIPNRKREGCAYVGIDPARHIYEYKGEKLTRVWIQGEGWRDGDEEETKWAERYIAAVLRVDRLEGSGDGD